MSEDYTQTNNCIEQIKKRHESSFNLDYISDVGFLLSHIHTLGEKVRELEKEKFYWNCPIHGKSQNAWGCPECVRELRQEKKQAETRTKKLEDAINNTGCLLLKNSIGKSKEVEDE